MERRPELVDGVQEVVSLETKREFTELRIFSAIEVLCRSCQKKLFLPPTVCSEPSTPSALKRISCLPSQSSVQSFRANVGGDRTGDIFRN